MAQSRLATFRALHSADQPLVLPNAWDHASAAALLAAGFPAVGTTSLGVAAANGLPDGEARTRDHTLVLARLLGTLPGLLTVDVEGGFADEPDEVAGFTAEIAAAGAVGINIEDGRGDAGLADPGRQAETIAAIKAAVPDLFVNARVDTHWLDLATDTTLARAERYRDAGADGIFVPGLSAPADIRALAASLDVPLNVLYAPGRHTVAELAELGARRISTGSLLYRHALHSAVETARDVRAGRPVTTTVPSYSDLRRPSR
ncbi:2-Methylisocitrate lyase, PEP mutase family [Amycolatopsis arida]|uniref:2-Methylisocitrate lyase, PEP mutase family n=1 Tax=Amycolatopsis arida TaxID=587909 RepID=A0A1I5QCK8_9PSEU|nr:isocitrate lyase/phosphoenolpyruvate mutase family protein [Amycolatopsis arida]TDX98793.1 2-methylisocitrate lyase-like PEP mutase family enzyme [Amycolatopsis arida]SFP44038.1 2-Methylisocitrate lyase, PEP mutase family [Amycolatopsis arida]